MVVGCLPTKRPFKRAHVGMAQRTTLPQASRTLKKMARSQATMKGSTTLAKAGRMKDGAAVALAKAGRMKDGAAVALAKADRMKEGAAVAQALEARQEREDTTDQRTNYAVNWMR